MAVSRKVEREILKENYLCAIVNLFTENGDEVLRFESNKVAIPVVGCEGNEDFITITVSVPTGANKGTEPFDGYAMAEDYQMRIKAKEEKAKADKEKKEKKAKRDAEIRAKKKEIAEKSK